MNAKAILTVLFLGHLSLLGQLNESFDFQLLEPPTLWVGDTDSFQILNNRAHLNAPANTSSSFISTPSNSGFNGTWSFEIELDFNPSVANKMLIYLMSDNQNLKDTLNGYFIMIGNTNDEISLYRQNGTLQTKIIDGPDNFIDLNNVSVLISVERNLLGHWSLYADTLSAQTNLVLQGSSEDNTFQYSDYFGILCQYTSTRSDKFYIDNVLIDAIPYQDFFPPYITNKIFGKNKVSIEMNEPIISPMSTNIDLLENSNQLSIIESFNFDSNFITIYSTIPFERNTPYLLELNQLTDTSGNTRDTSFIFGLSNIYSNNEIQFNEFYPDPTPSYGLPKAEFIEIRNNLDEAVYLDQFKLIDYSDTISFPSDTLFPFQNLILCSNNNVDSFLSYGPVLGLSNFPSLNNDLDFFQLNDQFDNVLDSLTYNRSWYRNLMDFLGNEKSSGGFSLERVDSLSDCTSIHNWYPCIDPIGGTPGSGTSVSFGDIIKEPNAIINAYFVSDTSCIISLNQEFSPASLYSDSAIVLVIDGNIRLPDSISNSYNKNIVIMSEYFNISSDNRVVLNIENCYNGIIQLDAPIYNIIPPQKGDLVINEILFNPNQNNYDFVEVFNRSNNAIALSNLILYEKPYESDTIVDFLNMETLTGLIPPLSYFVFTENKNALLNRYIVQTPSHVLDVPIPNFPDDKAGIGIMRNDSLMLDELFYEEKWHLETQNNPEGYSLEKIDVEEESSNSFNWQTCASQFMATPTYRNSQSFEFEGSNQFSISSEVFSPNQDGFLDFVQFSFIHKTPNSFASLKIFNIDGRPVKTITQNEILSEQNTWTWDGSDANRQLAPIGIYIIRLVVLTETGTKKVYKEKVVLGNNL